MTRLVHQLSMYTPMQTHQASNLAYIPLAFDGSHNDPVQFPPHSVSLVDTWNLWGRLLSAATVALIRTKPLCGNMEACPRIFLDEKAPAHTPKRAIEH